MNTEKAIGVLIGGCNLASRRGAFELKESAIINEAVEFFGVKQPEVAKPENPVENKETTSETTGTIDKKKKK